MSRLRCNRSWLMGRRLALILMMVPLVLCLSWLASAQTIPGKKVDLYAVIVGLNNFKDGNIPQLTLSARDAIDFHKFIEERKQLFARAHVTVLTNEQATMAEVTKAIREYLEPAKKEDIVFIYLSGHGTSHPKYPEEYYFVTYDTNPNNLKGTALWMSDQHLFKGIQSERVLLLTDACHSGGFVTGLEKPQAKALEAKSADRFYHILDTLPGRVGIASSKPDEKSYELPGKYGNSIFTHFLLKGLRGAAAKDPQGGVISAKELYNYVCENTMAATKNQQRPQFFSVKGKTDETPVFPTPSYAGPLRIWAEFFYEDGTGQEKQLTDGAVLKSGQRYGLRFSADSDCFVYIFWWDSAGNAGMMFPNPQLTEGTGQVRGGQTHWLPSRGGSEHWYVLDNNVGEERILLVASRQKNPTLDQLAQRLMTQGKGVGAAFKPKEAQEMEREVELMGVANYTVPKRTGSANLGARLDTLENEIQVSGADAVLKLRFQHVAP